MPRLAPKAKYTLKRKEIYLALGPCPDIFIRSMSPLNSNPPKSHSPSPRLKTDIKVNVSDVGKMDSCACFADCFQTVENNQDLSILLYTQWQDVGFTPTIAIHVEKNDSTSTRHSRVGGTRKIGNVRVSNRE